MRSLTLILSVTLSMVIALPAEEVTLFQCVSAGFTKAQDQDIEKVQPGTELSKIDTGSKTFRAMIEQYREGSWKAEPFYGPVKKFIVKDEASKLYIVHFEFLKGHKILDPGTRFAVTELQSVSGNPGEFIGDPYNGSSVTEKAIVDQIQRVAAKLEEPGKKP